MGTGVGTLGRLLAALAGLCIASSPLFSQTANGRISGSVKDQTDAVILGATVSVIDTQRGTTRILTTDDAGAFNAPELIPGTYSVKAEYKGFKVTERDNIVVEVGSELGVDLVLEPGQQTEEVTVSASTPLVETTTAALGGTISDLLVSDLPIKGRNFVKLLELRPGVYLAPGAGKWAQSSNGMRREHNVYLLNGIDTIEGFSSQNVVNGSPFFGDATSTVPIEAIQEFNTEQIPKAEYGWKPGSIISVGLKSGTNALHGAAYAFGRDDALDAKNPFIQAGTPKQTTAIENFGGAVGGAIKKDKLFYFLTYEGSRNTIGAPSSTITLPTTPSGLGTTNSALDACNGTNGGNKLAAAPSDLSLAFAGLTYNAATKTCAVDPTNSGCYRTGPR